MSDKVCEDCWYCEDVRDGVVVNEHIRSCTVGSTEVCICSYTKACDKFMSRTDGLKWFMESYKTAQKPNTNK